MYSYGTGSSSSGQIINIPSSSLTDGAWHNITLTSSGGQVTLTVNNAPKSAMFADPHEFTGLGLTGMALGGTETPLVINGRSIEGKIVRNCTWCEREQDVRCCHMKNE